MSDTATRERNQTTQPATRTASRAAQRPRPIALASAPNWFDTQEAIARNLVPIPLARRAVVRCFDLVLASSALMLLLPLLLMVFFTVAVTSGGPAIYVHWRLGRTGHLFPCLKFRSMHRDADRRLDEVLQNDQRAAAEWRQSQKIRNDPRVTPVGRLLRKTNIDELPQLINVILGQMSIVGPRPIVWNEAVRFGRHLPVVLSVKPGLTGLWQVSGRNDTSYEERVRLDVSYVRTRSLRTDAYICVRTALQMARPRSNGAY